MEWIDVNDRLPNEEQEILFTHTEIINPFKNAKVQPTVFGGWYRKGKVYSWIGEFDKPKESRSFTHWMPLPEPPVK